jgi:hypothetical protein
VPDTQLQGALRGRIGHNFDLGLVYERGLASTSQKLDRTQPDIDHGDVPGYGMAMQYSIATGDPRFRVGLTSDLIIWSVPWIEYATCVEFCPGGPTTTYDKGRDSVATLGFGIVPSFRSGRVSLFAGLAGRNQPTITAKAVEGEDYGEGGEVRGGPFNLVASAGAEIELGGGVRTSMIVSQVASSTPIKYTPTISAALIIPLVPGK